MISGRGGMGTRKHRKSGRVPTNKTNAMSRAREENQKRKEQARLRELRKTPMKTSVKELLP